MSIQALTQDDALSLARQSSVDGVRLLALDYNWGPPVSGRYDSDYLNVWGVVPGEADGALFLYGQQVNGGWDLNLPFQRVEVVQDRDGRPVTLFALSEGSQNQFPTQFVLRYDPAEGPPQYDNNGGWNYELIPYLGRGATGVSTPDAIFVLNGITPYGLKAAPEPAPTG
ncbi:MAG TPA: hypothetical protein VFJ82_02190 [Longimicrobium sp.]|nr:hypothetical protein [Longimicrobium sp.]